MVALVAYFLGRTEESQETHGSVPLIGSSDWELRLVRFCQIAMKIQENMDYILKYDDLHQNKL